MKTYRMALPGILALVLVFALSTPVLADEGTTTDKSAGKDFSDNTEIYLTTRSPGSDYPYYGAKWEPEGGVLYGRTVCSGQLSSGNYGAVNAEFMENESIVSYYTYLGDSYRLSYWSYIFNPILKDGDHALLVYLNFNGEEEDCKKAIQGIYDAELEEDFRYLSQLVCPVFLRIGGEMNLWADSDHPENFIAAYRHIADLCRALAPNTALVFSPNFTAATGVDMDAFYPGDSYVDWVGTSLYYNRYANNGDTRWPEFYGVGAYGDAMLNVQQTIHLSRLHSKPVMITEGGSGNTYDGVDISDWAADHMGKAYTFLSMVYPEIKCIVATDYSIPGSRFGYTFYDNATVTATYNKAIAGNPTFVHSYKDTGMYYTKLSGYTGAWDGTMELTAYTFTIDATNTPDTTDTTDTVTAAWYVDGQWKSNAMEYPYRFTLDAGELGAGIHTVEVRFINGAQMSVPFEKKGVVALPSGDPIYLDGEAKSLTVYKIDNSNYFKLRDLAALLSGSTRQFNVEYDAATASITVIRGQVYAAVGGELSGTASGQKTAVPSNNSIYVDGEEIRLTAYKIDGSNYFKLRDLGQVLDFYVGYDSAMGVTISGSVGYPM